MQEVSGVQVRSYKLHPAIARFTRR